MRRVLSLASISNSIPGQIIERKNWRVATSAGATSDYPRLCENFSHRLTCISHGTRYAWERQSPDWRNAKSPIGRLAFPGFKPCSAYPVCIAIGRRSQSNYPERTAFQGVGPAPSWRTGEKYG